MVIPEAMRDRAQIQGGDKLEIGYASGLIVLWKRQAKY